jgi:hypothetical protein
MFKGYGQPYDDNTAFLAEAFEFSKEHREQ